MRKRRARTLMEVFAEEGEGSVSYDVTLSENWCEHCGRGDQVFAWNYTSNMAGAWWEAGADLYGFHGKRAGRCAGVLRVAVGDMVSRPEHYLRFNSPNGWGSMATLVPALRELLEAMEKHPNAVVSVDR
jgi:hypothetical protein